MIPFILFYGAIGGLFVGVWMAWQVLGIEAGTSVKDALPGMLATYLMMLIALTAVFVGVKHYRDKVLGGVIRFLPAFGLGLAISAVASAVYVAAWEISSAYSTFDFARYWSDYLIESAKAKGASAVEIAKATEEAKAFAESFANPLFRVPMVFIEMFPVGVLVSLVSALILRNSRVLPARSVA